MVGYNDVSEFLHKLKIIPRAKPGDYESFANIFYGWLPDFGTVYDNTHADKRSDLLRDKSGVNLFAAGTNAVAMFLRKEPHGP